MQVVVQSLVHAVISLKKMGIFVFFMFSFYAILGMQSF